MTFDTPKVRQHLQVGTLAKLFTQELGWDRHAAPLPVSVGNQTFALTALAEKRGVVVYECPPDAAGRIPDYTTRRAIEKQVTKAAFEHLLIFTDREKATQVWQWVARGPGRPAAFREVRWHRGQTGDALVQKLAAISIPLSEDEALDLTGTVTKLRDAFDRDRVTKRFFDDFKAQHAQFLEFIKGILNLADRAWYGSLMLNRLMFVYFIQKKGFLDGDRDYLRNKLAAVKAQKGKGKFHTFYLVFLRKLFHEGFGKQKPVRKLDADLAKLLGEVPYLNGGLFEVHQLEEANPDLNIPDDAFDRLFAFFDQYEWHLDSRPLAAGNEINPDVLGYIFEKYINQKQMGAYYTKEDITDYIGKNTILPRLLDATREQCAVAFAPGSALWKLLADNPDRYLYPAVRHGVIDEKGNVLPLPAEIAAGIADVSKRGKWNRPAAEPFALPTETWREHVARRTRCLDVRSKLAAGEVHTVNDLVTLNLDIRQFVEDAIAGCDGPDLLRAFSAAVTTVTVLDPTCGSGAFLFAALNILQPLYDACLDRMKAFVDDADALGKSAPKTFDDFRSVLKDADLHPSRDYFVLKSIAVRNLFGVDIMAEAVEICKLRLFLKLVAQVERAEQLEPLPDIDFNIRAGNTLVGFANRDDVELAFGARKTETRTMDFGDELGEIEHKASELNRRFKHFRDFQTSLQSEQVKIVNTKHERVTKADLRSGLAELRDQLDRTLAGVYGVDPDKPKAFADWRQTHQPFHWFVEFYGILAAGGFDVVIGNPPWKEYATVRKEYTVRGYSTEGCGNLHGICTERSLALRAPMGRMSFIVQLPLTCSSRMDSVRKVLLAKSSALHVIPFDDRPGKLFEGLQHCRSTIFFSAGTGSTPCIKHVARYQRWPTETREFLFPQLHFAALSNDVVVRSAFPKISDDANVRVLCKLFAKGEQVGAGASSRVTKSFVFYQEAMQYWSKATIGLPYYAKDGKVGAPAHGRYVYCTKPDEAAAVCAILNSSLFYAYFIAYSDCFHLNDSLVTQFPIPAGILSDARLAILGRTLQRSLTENSTRKVIDTRDGSRIEYAEFRAGLSKPILDDIDGVLAEHYGFTAEELDFIVNYDIKYRLGADAAGEEDE